jgi:hypothetical protein
MKKVTYAILFFLLLLVSAHLRAQMMGPCLPQGIEFTSQAQLDSFSILYPGCNAIIGDVHISGDDIMILTGLAPLDSIGGDLEIADNPNLIRLTGLEGLDSIGGRLMIRSNAGLQTIEALDSLTFVGSHVILEGNNALESLVGFALDSIRGNFRIAGHANLFNLEGLDSLKFISGDWVIEENSGMEGLGPVGRLTGVGGSVEVRVNNLANLEALLLDSIGGSLVIEGNPQLMDLTGLDSLRFIGFDFIIADNDGMTELNVSARIDRLPRHLIIEDNDNLMHFGSLPLDSVMGDFYIRHNSSMLNFEGLDSLKYIGGGWYVEENPSLIGFGPPLRSTGINTAGTVRVNNLANLEAYNVHSINGYLLIEGNPNLKDLTGLDSLHYLGGDFNLDGNISMDDFTGFALDSIHGSLIIRNNTSLPDLDGLDSLKYIGLDMDISDNPNLTHFRPRARITGLRSLTIARNNSLEDLIGFDLDSLDGSLTIEDNPLLKDLTGLDSLDYVNGDVNMDGNVDAADFSVWRAHTVMGDFNIRNHPSLPDLDGLDSLQFIGGRLELDNNDGLTNLDGLRHLDPLMIQHIQISNSALLSDCAMMSVCGFLENGGSADIFNNAPGCNSVDEVFQICVVDVKDPFGEESEVILFPNPTNGLLEIHGINPEEWQVTLTNINGLVIRSRSSGHQLLDLSALPEGVYFLKIVSPEFQMTKQIVKY